MIKEPVLITGCAGFIGSHAVDYFLLMGHPVIGLDSLTHASSLDNLTDAFSNKNFFFLETDICNTEIIAEVCYKRSVKWIFNFAAETHVDRSIVSCKNFIHSNIIGVESLLEVCRWNGIKLFHVSTDEIYGPAKDKEFEETDNFNPTNPYSATKAAAEHLINSYCNTYGIEYLIVRPSNNYGPRQYEEKLIPTIVKCLQNDKKVPVYGTGKNVRDWLYVEDSVKMIYSLWQSGSINDVFNITCKNEKTNLAVIKLICQIMNKDFDSSIEFVSDRLGHDFKYSISNKKISLLDIDCPIEFDDKIQKTVLSLLEKS